MRLRIPDKLYGRDRAIASLGAAFDRACRGRGGVLLIPGASGAGKTALVETLRRPVEDRNGFFLAGKFNQYQQGLPYFAIRQALTALCHQLERDDQHLEHWRSELRQAVGTLGQLLLEVVPGLATLLGPQPAVADINPLEARHRFVKVLREFLKVVARPEHPVVLFIDDWQWADTASLELLASLQGGAGLDHLLVAASYRDDEVDAAHPLTAALEDLRRHDLPVVVLEVHNLAPADVRTMLVETIGPDAEDLDGLTAFLHRRTAGNPFFLRLFIEWLYEQGRLRFEPAVDRWTWSVGDGGGRGLPADVVELFAQKLTRLEPAKRELLSRAACLGSRFDLETLARVSDRTVDECQRALTGHSAEGLVIAVDEVRAPLDLQFLHDRVQQAAYGLIEPARLPEIRLELGRLLLAHLDPDQLAERIFQVVDHFNAGQVLVQDPAEFVVLVTLNVRAARDARAGAAYGAALHFHRAAARFLDRPGFAERLWRDHHELARHLFLEWADSEFLEGDRQQAELCVREAVARAGSAIEKAECLNVLIVHFTLEARYPEAIAAGREGLAALGIVLPDTDYEASRDAEIARVRQAMDGRSLEDLTAVPAMSDPRTRAAAQLLIALGPPCYRSHQRLWGVIVPTVVNLTLRYGHIPQIGYSHTAFGGLLIWVAGDFGTAALFALLATRLMEGTFQSPSDQSVFHLMIGSSVRHWFEPLRSGSRDYSLAYEAGSRSGNLQYAAYAFGHNMYCRLYQGTPLRELQPELQRSLAFSRTRGNQWAIDLLEGGLMIVTALTDVAAEADDTEVLEADFLLRVETHHNIQIDCIYKVLRAFSLLILGQCERALVWSEKAAPLIYTVGTQGLLPWPEHVFARCLMLTALYADAPAARQAAWRAELDRMLEQLRLWADHGPANFAHKHALVAAEMARLDGRAQEAARLYHDAAQSAGAGGFLQWEGLANERAAAFWETRGQGRLASGCWQRAYVCYDQWGATAKLRAMEAAYAGRPALDMFGLATPGAVRDASTQALERDLSEALLRQLQSQAARSTYAQLQLDAARESEALAAAAERLRVEVAERRRTEDALRESEASLNAMGEVAQIGGWEIDVESGTLKWTRETYRIQEVDGDVRPTVDAALAYYAPESRPAIAEAVQRAVEQGEAFDKELEIITTTGKRRWVRALGYGHRRDGRIVKVTGAIQDITTRKQAEAETARLEGQLRQSQRMESVGRLAGGVAHEFNNMLTVILGTAEMALSQVDPSQPLHADLEEIHKAATHSADVTRQLLAYARKQIVAPRVLDINETVSSSVRILGKLIGEDISLTWQPAAQLWPVKMDPSQLYQILSTLCVNARDAIGGTGQLLIATENTSVADAFCATQPDAVAGQYAVLTVSDNGCGMDPAILPTLFEPFTTTKDVGQGTGLGLSTVYGIVRQNAGFVTVSSEVGTGTTFRIYLPRHGSEIGEALAPVEVKAPRADGETILVVEDEPAILRLTTKMLEREGYTVLASCAPEEAVRLAREHAGVIQLLMTDVVMPAMNGQELARQIVALRPAIRCLFMSGYAADVITRRGELAADGHFISKPFTRHDMAAKLRQVLDGE